MTEPTRVEQAAPTEHLSWWKSITRSGHRQWQPGASHYQPYRAAGGRGAWMLRADGTNIWATNNIDFDRSYWAEFDYQHPLTWCAKEEPKGIPVGDLDPGESISIPIEFRRTND